MSRTLLFLLALVSPFSHAFQLSDAMIDAEVVKVNNVVSVDSDGIKVNVTGKGFKPSAPYFQTTAVIPKPTFMSFVKGNIKSLTKRSPYYIGWAATMAAAGWAIDELTGQVVSKPKDYAVGTFYYLGDYGRFNYFASATPVQSCKAYFSGNTTWQYDSFRTPATGAHGVCVGALISKPTSKSDMIRVYQSACSAFPQSQVNTCTGSEVPYEPVADGVLYDSLASQMTQDLNAAAQAFMQPGQFPYPYPQLFPTPLKYIPGVSEADYPLLDCYFKGNLQSTNPGGACYATQVETDRIKALGDKIKVTTGTGGQIEQANDELSKPLTQAQLEESLNKLSGSDVNKVTDDASKIYDTGFKQLNDSIVANTLPGMPDLIPLPQFQTGSCRSITLQFSFAGKNVTKQFPGDLGCTQLEKMKEFLGWLMAIAVTIGLMFAALREAN